MSVDANRHPLAARCSLCGGATTPTRKSTLAIVRARTATARKNTGGVTSNAISTTGGYSCKHLIAMTARETLDRTASRLYERNQREEIPHPPHSLETAQRCIRESCEPDAHEWIELPGGDEPAYWREY